ncbi:hypothetical protein CNY89_16035 [Amaricoccus sp. HAR-UPW-R2A-40]|nr:hypothetical protein CNY89_16035 [Amaricoccus sp. HAR-UPW-R2A-40]
MHKQNEDAVREDWAVQIMQDAALALDLSDQDMSEPYVPEDCTRSGAFDVEYAVIGGKRRTPPVPVRMRRRRR